MAAINLAKVAKFCDTAKPRAHFAARQRHPAARFLTRRIEYFRPTATSLANTRKSEPPDKEAHTSKALPQTARRGPFLPLYGAKRADFSFGKWPWMEKSTGRNGRSTGCFGKSIPRMHAPRPPQGRNLPERRTDAPVRFNALPNGAQGPAAKNGNARRNGPGSDTAQKSDVLFARLAGFA